MRREGSFADVLERELERGTYQSEPRAPRPAEPFRAAPLHPFLFSTPLFTSPRAAFAWAAPTPRPRRTLTSRQERALGELVKLGANLTRDFTASELRRAFRMLARQYHPDRHPDSSDSAKARLSRLFAEAAENYRQLLDAFAPLSAC
jgi:hypothetical protein